MGYCQFIQGLLEEGRATAPNLVELSEEELRAGDQLLAQFEASWRIAMPAKPPPLNPVAARWGATRLLHASQFAIYRDLGQEQLEQVFAEPYPGPADAAAHYSVDLMLRFLPDLFRFVAEAAQRDPLVEALVELGRTWPLSSVGIKQIEDTNCAAFATSESLLQLYTDRIIAAGDISRLADPLARAGVAATLGAFPELSPKMHAALKDEEPTPVSE